MPLEVVVSFVSFEGGSAVESRGWGGGEGRQEGLQMDELPGLERASRLEVLELEEDSASGI